METFCVAYDISDPKRLRKVAQICEDFGLRKQFSVFFCRLSALDLVRLKSRLYDVMDLDRDQVLFIPLCAPVLGVNRDVGSSDRAAGGEGCGDCDVTRPSFDQLFQQATLNESPLPYQYRLALADPFPTLVDVPTGLGKTAAAILAWVWRRQFAVDAVRRQTPRRLVYCLPMRVLVEQTFNEAVRWLDRLGLLAGDAHWDERGVDTLPTKEARLSRSHPGADADTGPRRKLPPFVGGPARTAIGSATPVAVHLLLGGEEASDWALWPERDAILIGTQDMLLSAQ